jgi:ketosteroid isomerase-like protein
MSRENVDRAREVVEYHDRTGQPCFELMRDDIVWRQRAEVPDSRTYHRHAGVASLVAEWVTAFDNLGFDVAELIDAGDRVVAVVLLHGQIRASLHRVETATSYVCPWLDGRLAEVAEYATKAEALHAVDLEE